MIFEKVDASAETASVRLDQDGEGRPVAVVTRTSGAKSREKLVKVTGRFEASLQEIFAKSVVDRAIVQLLKEGYVVRPDSRGGPIRWMTYSEVGYSTSYPCAIDDRGAVWVGSSGVLLRIDRGTGDSLAIPVPYRDPVVVRHIAVGPGGLVAVLAETVASGSYLVFRVVDGTSLALVERIDFTKQSCARIVSTVSVAAGGRILGPHEDGSALFEPDGTVVRTFAVGTADVMLPVAALDGAGTTAVFALPAGKLRRIDLATGAEKTLSGSFASAGELVVHADLTVDVWENAGDWGAYRMSPTGRCTRLGTDRAPYGAVTEDVLHLASCADDGMLVIRDPRNADSIRSTPLLGAARGARIRFAGDGQIVARTDQGVTLGIDPSRLFEVPSLASLLGAT